MELLNAIVAGESLSPTYFSMSVHNTASGLHSIANQDKSPSSVVAAGVDTLESAFLDAAAFLHTQDNFSKVLLIAADDILPEPFIDFTGEKAPPPYAVAFLLSNRKRASQLSLGFHPGKNTKVADKEPHALTVVRFLLNKSRQLILESERLTWTWRIHNERH